MKNNKSGKYFVQQFVLGFGFLSGLWIHIGFDPKTAFLSFLSGLLQQVWPNPLYSVGFWIIPVISVALSLFWAFHTGGLFGLIAVTLAFISGIFINFILAWWILILAIIIGLIAPFLHKKAKF